MYETIPSGYITMIWRSRRTSAPGAWAKFSIHRPGKAPCLSFVWRTLAATTALRNLELLQVQASYWAIGKTRAPAPIAFGCQGPV